VPMNDIQGIILRGYEVLDAARFFLLEIQDAVAAKNWVRDLADAVTSAASRPEESAINVAFTSMGLQKLGLNEQAFRGFAREFQESMDTDHRRRVLGDTSPLRTPEHWDWGNRDDFPHLHVLLLVYARGRELLDQIAGRYEAGFPA